MPSGCQIALLLLYVEREGSLMLAVPAPAKMMLKCEKTVRTSMHDRRQMTKTY